MRVDLTSAVLASMMAMIAQYLLCGGGIAFASLEPAVQPEHVHAAKSERDINEQQRRSAQKFAQMGLPSDEEQQPDEVRLSSETLIETDLVMRCGEKLPPESAWTTRGVEIHVRAHYHGQQPEREHQWKYVVSFRNGGLDTVQMLTRHWIFINEDGVVHEMKGPGARGVTPVLGPGDSWQYESGTTLSTPTGSMHGSFQFATLKSPNSGTRLRSFSARVARLTLSADDKGALTPCADTAAAAALLPATSVHATRRVIVGASSRYYGFERVSTPSDSLHQFVYDVQINNARAEPVTVVGHRWEVQTREQAERGEATVISGQGAGGTMEERELQLPAGEAMRIQGLLTAAAPMARAYGAYTVRLGREGLATIEVKIGEMALSIDERPVPRFGLNEHQEDDDAGDS